MKQTSIRNNIRALRFRAGEMTQQALADTIGVSRQTVVAIEGAKYSPTLELAFRIAATFGLPLGEVFVYDPASDRNAKGPAGLSLARRSKG